MERTWRACQLRQDGAVVSGCYDQDGDLTGTVTGNVLKALGVDRSDRVPSAFILSVRADGTLLGVRSSNRAPFVVYAGDCAPAGSGPPCPPPPPAVLGCGAVIHGINFDFDSATIRPDSEPVLSSCSRDSAAIEVAPSSSKGTRRTRGPTSTTWACRSVALRPSWRIRPDAAFLPAVSRRLASARNSRLPPTTTRADGHSTGGSRCTAADLATSLRIPCESLRTKSPLASSFQPCAN